MPRCPRLPARLTVLLGIVALLATLAPTGVASAGTASRDEPLAVGAHVHAMWSSYDTATRAEVFDRLAAAGATWIRVDVGWASLEAGCAGCRQEWHVDRLHEILAQAADRDLEVLAVLWRTPGWANDGDVLAPPDDPDDYARAARWISEEFAGEVAAWQVWNEPNLDDFWHGSLSEYVALLKAAAPALRAGDPAARVVLGGPSKNDTDWLADVYARGAGPSFDVLATHPYMTPADAPPETADDGDDIGTIEHVEVVRDLMEANGDAGKPIWFTEFGWSAHPTAPDAPAWKRGVSESQQADYLVRALRMVEERYPYVTNVFWYVARDQDSGDAHLDGYGLLRRDLSPKPAYHAMATYLATRPVGGLLPVLPDLPLVDRVAGPDRVATAVAVSAGYWDRADDVVLATARDFPDALAAGALTAALDAPLLLTERDRLPDAVAAELARLGARRVHVLGGSAAVGAGVLDALHARGLRVRRLAGADRFATAAAVATAAGAPARTATVVLGRHADATRDAWPDALAAGALAASPDRPPTLLTTADHLPDVTLAALRELRVTDVRVVGGPTSISDAVLVQLRAAGLDATRVSGATRYATSAATARVAAADRHPAAVVVATGAAFPDGLSAIALAAHVGGTVVLAPPSGLADAPWTRDVLDDLAADTVLVGGEQALAPELADELRVLAGS